MTSMVNYSKVSEFRVVLRRTLRQSLRTTGLASCLGVLLIVAEGCGSGQEGGSALATGGAMPITTVTANENATASR